MTLQSLIGAYFIEAIEGGVWYMGGGYWTDDVSQALYRGCLEAIQEDAKGLPERSYMLVKMGSDMWTHKA